MTPITTEDRKGLLIAAAICLAYLILAVCTAPHYGMTWDEAETDWYHAERNLNYLLTFDQKWVDFGERLDPTPWPDHPELFALSSPYKTLNFGNMISAMGCRIFHRWLHVAGAVEAHHWPNFLLVAGMLAAMFSFMRRKYGVVASSTAMVAIAFQPHFWANTHFDTKDIPYACFMAFTMLAARGAIIRRSPGKMLAASALLGLAGATKPNAALIPVLIVIWYAISRKEIREKAPAGDASGKRKALFLAAIILSPLIAFAIFIATWPYMWSFTFMRIKLFLDHYLFVAASGPNVFQWDALERFVAVQPPAVLIFGGIGIIVAIRDVFRGKDRDENSFLLLWLCAPVARMVLPGVLDYDGVRHFIEYAIPLGALTGIGIFRAYASLAKVISKFSDKYKKPAMVAVVAAMAVPFVAWFVVMLRMHPYEIVYYNFLVGGTRGANAKWADATDYWGSSYRQGIAWLNENAERNATVVVPVGGYIVKGEKRVWLRNDINVVALLYTDKIGTEEYLGQLSPEDRSRVYSMFITKRGWYNRFAHEADSQWRERFSIIVDSTPILKILKAPDSGK